MPMERLSFQGLPVIPDPFRAGGYVLSGPADGRYAKFHENFERCGVRYYGGTVLESIDPAMICGVGLHPHELEHPEDFWSQHKIGGTPESFPDPASLEPVKVLRGPGFYWFQDDGRHRVAAARIRGARLTVRVIGRIK